MARTASREQVEAVRRSIDRALKARPESPTPDSVGAWLFGDRRSVAATVGQALGVPALQEHLKTKVVAAWRSWSEPDSEPVRLWKGIGARLSHLSRRSPKALETAFARRFKKRLAGVEESSKRKQILQDKTHEYRDRCLYEYQPWHEAVASYLAESRQPLCTQADMLTPAGNVPPEPGSDLEDADEPPAPGSLPPGCDYKQSVREFQSPVLGDCLSVHVMRRLVDGVQAVRDLALMVDRLGICIAIQKFNALDSSLEGVKTALWYAQDSAERENIFALVQVYVGGYGARADIASVGIDPSVDTGGCAGQIVERVKGCGPRRALERVRQALGWLAGICSEHLGQATVGGDREPPVSGDAGADNQQPSHSEDFTSVDWFGQRYEFSRGQQADCVKVLWEEWERGEHSLGQDTIAESIGTEARRFRLDHVFRLRDGSRRMHPAWGTMIVRVSEGVYRLKK